MLIVSWPRLLFAWARAQAKLFTVLLVPQSLWVTV